MPKPVLTKPDIEQLATALSDTLVMVRRLVPNGQLSVTALSTLSRLEARGESRVGDLANGESVTQPAMTQLLSRLQEQGFIERHADPDDGRVVLVSLTAAGRRLISNRRAVRAQALADRLALLRPEELTALAAALPTLQRLVAGT